MTILRGGHDFSTLQFRRGGGGFQKLPDSKTVLVTSLL